MADRQRGPGAATVITSIFDEAQRRDPTHRRTWVFLVDGAKHQIACIQAQAQAQTQARQVQVAIVCDFIHVLECLWYRHMVPGGDIVGYLGGVSCRMC